jgi:hypothetical protein
MGGRVIDSACDINLGCHPEEGHSFSRWFGCSGLFGVMGVVGLKRMRARFHAFSQAVA